MNKLLNKVALVTGGSRGIGRAIVLELVKAGASVAINYEKNEEKAKETLALIKEIGGSGIIIKGDISKGKYAEEVIKKVIETYGRLDILVNNAGKSHIGLFMDMKDEEMEGLIQTNLLSAMYLSKYAMPYLLEKGGNIINISSMWGEVGASCEVAYSASKGGMNLFTRALAKEMGRSGVRINGIAPGVINTEMNSFLNKEDREELEEEIPLGFFGEGEDIGKAVVFLVCEGGRYINGEIIRVDGGII